ncbi:GNAT family N-acetyltransferase [Rhizobium leguminosarum]|uniref:GNAT family N-acetyltransferase n=1 Tax=Rhizobium leguminosarum TaxID=384 RepID=UPI001C93C7C9|nr:GNAT family N-acetyltransferase [Rhizobium leguminosarum]MBY5585693.1 GNAT family N-acetyltransferase [Rhizobium leguminosarum]
MDRPSASRQAVPEEDITEAKAFIDLFMIAPQTLADQAEFRCMQLAAGCAISLPSAPAIGLNRVLGIAALEDLDTAFEWMSKKAGRRYLQMNASSAPQQTHDWIRKRGLVPQGNGWAKLRRTAPSTPLIHSGEVATRQVKVTEAEIFGAMMCAGFNFPANLTPLWSAIVGKDGWTCFFAELDGRPIATGAMYAADGRAWLGGGATVPEFRNRGAQKALITARLNQGISQGVQTFVVETAQPSAAEPNISHANLIVAGFEQIYTRMNYRFPDDS